MAAVAFNNSLANRQSDARSRVFGAIVQAFKDFEDSLVVLRRNADAVVADKKFAIAVPLLLANMDFRRRGTSIRVLHIEDDRIQQGIVSLHLLAMKECNFEIEQAAKEDEAIDAWLRGSFDLVILDHQLAEGNGVSCLRRIRQFDPVVSIIAVSGEATPETAAELIEAGADDYLSKQNLTGSVLSQSVRNVLTRANAFRNRYSALRSTPSTRAAQKR